MKQVLYAAAAALVSCAAQAQTYHDTSSTVVPGVVPLVGCSSGGSCAGPISATNPMPVSGSFSASLTGFQPTPAYAGLSVSTTSSRVALPAGTVVVVYNTGSSPAFVTLGGSGVTATTANDVIQPNSWMAFTTGPNTYLAAIETAGATALNLSGGAGLPTGGGGASGGGGGSNASVSSTGSAAPASATYMGANSSGSIAGLVQANASAPVNIAVAATTQLVAAASGKKIYVTAWDVISGGTGAITLEYGTQTASPCDTGTVALTGPYALTAQAGISKGNGLAPVFVTPAGAQLCAVTSAAVQMSGSVSYTQF